VEGERNPLACRAFWLDLPGLGCLPCRGDPMKQLALLLALVFSAGSLLAQSDAAREFQQLTDQRNKAIEAAAEPINRRYKSDLEALLRRATQIGDLTTAVKVKEAIARLGGSSSAPTSASNPVGKWRFVINGRGYIRTFHDDGTVTGQGPNETGTWRVSGGKIVVKYRNGHETKIDLPLLPKGTKAEGDGGDKQTIEKVD
jgi:hypothetical protein